MYGVPVCLKNGQTELCDWLGFIDKEDAKKIPGAVPVKIKAIKCSNQVTNFVSDDRYSELPEGKFIQGCLVPTGVYGVTETRVRVVG